MAAAEKYRLVIDYIVNGVRGREQIVGDSIDDLRPTVVEDCGGNFFERYGDEDDYVEIRCDHVVVRSLNVVLDESERRPSKVPPITAFGPASPRGEQQ